MNESRDICQTYVCVAMIVVHLKKVPCARIIHCHVHVRVIVTRNVYINESLPNESWSKSHVMRTRMSHWHVHVSVLVTCNVYANESLSNESRSS